ncbi:MAG: hypothetical protein GXO97_05945 [Nitrospirae bacterium]|nr:hypothetical protein [Nitrospirota bacterium]
MSHVELISKFYEREYILSRYIYPVLTGLIFAYLVSSIVNLTLYRIDIKPPSAIVQIKNSTTNRNIFVKNITEKNILQLEKGTEANIAGTDRNNVPLQKDSLTGYELVGTIVGKDSVAILKKDRNIFIIKKGQRIKGYKLISVSFDGITLKGNTGSVIIKFPEKIKEITKKTTTPFRSVLESNKVAKLDKVVVKRSEVISKSKDLNKLLTTVRISPFYRKDKFLGYRINMLKRGSFLYQLGLRPGDILQRINGEEIDSPDKAIEMLSKLEDITAVNIDLLRRGAKKTLFIEIED